ncbi:MAG: hypothetical protein O7G87_00745 [bacterium]|nr:hypothetical protein [bacterium]
MKPHAILLFTLLLSESALAQSIPPSDTLAYQQTLRFQKTALELELAWVSTYPEAYYLVVDIPAGKIELKSGAHLLHTCTIQGGSVQTPTQAYTLRYRIDPQTPEPGNQGLRLRGRHLPLDFQGRLIEGPRHMSSLYFSPPLILTASQPFPSIPHLQLFGPDIKALGSALRPGDRAILIPNLPTDSGASR